MHWKQQFSGIEQLLLPVDYTHPAEKTSFDVISKDINATVTLQLRETAARQNTTLFVLLLSAFKVLLANYTAQDDIISLVGFDNNVLPENNNAFDGIIYLPVRIVIDGDASFARLLATVNEATKQAKQNAGTSYKLLIEEILPGDKNKQADLFKAIFLMLPQKSNREPAKEPGDPPVKTDVTLRIIEKQDGLWLHIDYCTQLFTANTISRMMVHYIEILFSIAVNEQQSTGTINMLAEEEKHRLLNFYNNTVKYPKEKTVIDLFTGYAKKFPGDTALVFENKKLTYTQLDEQSSQLANYLKANNVTDGSLVPVLLNRGLEVIIAIIGIMKAGAAYVPIDPELPFDRIAHILQDIDASIIITGHAEQAILQEGAGHPGKNHYILNIEKQWSEIDKQPATHTTNISQSGLAYVIYTSGSTGKPKGVKIKHRSLVDYVFGLENKITISECKSFALVSTISADLGNTVIFSSLAFGGALHLFTKETISNPWQLTSYFTDNKIDCLKIVPSHWQALCTDEKILLPEKRLIFGGEALPGKIISRIKATGTECTVVNHYGPTETTIGKLLNKIDIHTPCEGVVPLGKPFGNTNIYILNKHKALCATGLAGELYIEGDGVADGYLNRDDLTAERFITNPFNTEGKRLYKTGDLVTYLPDGSVAFLGRVDDQVKIRGYRIELNEIASILEQCPLVKQAAVIAKNTGDTKKIAAYIVPAGVYNKYEITAYLKSRLPAYMIPSLFMQLEKLPLTENGKIDKKNLPEIEEEETYLPDFAAPVTDDEKMISEIWCELLGYEKISINSNFFELGGDSLTAIKLMARLQKKLDINLPLAILFQYSTIKTLAANLRCQDDHIKWECLVPIRTQGNKTPAYIVHGVGGHVLVLNYLLKYISPEQPLYGLQPNGIKGKSEIPRTIEDIAAYYIQEILQQNQTGPYIIGGFSFGGIIAFEMAQQLTAMGKEVKMLVMFDTYLGRFYEKASPFTKLGWKLHKIIYTCVLLWQNPKVKIAFEKRKFKDKVLRQYNELRWKLKGNKVKKNHMYYIYKIQDGLKSARRIYKPAPYKGEIHLFRAKKKTFYFHDYTYLGWQPFALNGIKTHDMPGEHEKIFLPPDDTIFGITLQQCLDECDASFGSK